jgi:uncharacterized oxidoreductase
MKDWARAIAKRWGNGIRVPKKQFIEETIAVLRTDADEILVDAAKPLRANAGPNEHGLVNGFNAQMMAIFAGS